MSKPLGYYAAGMRKLLDKYIEDQEVNVTDLTSYSCGTAPGQGLDRFRMPIEECYDEDELWQAKATQAFDYMTYDKWYNSIPLKAKWLYVVFAADQTPKAEKLLRRIQTFCEDYLTAQAEGDYSTDYTDKDMWDEINKHLGV